MRQPVVLRLHARSTASLPAGTMHVACALSSGTTAQPACLMFCTQFHVIQLPYQQLHYLCQQLSANAFTQQFLHVCTDLILNKADGCMHADARTDNCRCSGIHTNVPEVSRSRARQCSRSSSCSKAMRERLLQPGPTLLPAAAQVQHCSCQLGVVLCITV